MVILTGSKEYNNKKEGQDITDLHKNVCLAILSIIKEAK